MGEWGAKFQSAEPVAGRQGEPVGVEPGRAERAASPAVAAAAAAASPTVTAAAPAARVDLAAAAAAAELTIPWDMEAPAAATARLAVLAAVAAVAVAARPEALWAFPVLAPEPAGPLR